MERQDYLAAALLGAAIAALAATIVLVSLGIYFFIFFLPITFGLPWSIKKLFRKKRRHSLEDLR